MEPGRNVAIWLHDGAAKLFLGLTGKRPISRWVVIGQTLSIPDAPIGVWVDVQYIEEQRPIKEGKVKLVRYGVKPGQCLIRWEYIITAQNRAQDTKDSDKPRMGFVQS